MQYFSADFHLGHVNILKYDKRPFDNIFTHNEAIIQNCEDTLKKGDSLYYLGDFSMATISNTISFFERLKDIGIEMYFIRGNHDKKDMIKLYQKYGIYLGEQKTITIEGKPIVLNHYRMEVWDRSHHGSWHLHGHSHHGLPERKDAYCIDVGINGAGYNYTPISFSHIELLMSKKIYKRKLHHENYEK